MGEPADVALNPVALRGTVTEDFCCQKLVLCCRVEVDLGENILGMPFHGPSPDQADSLEPSTGGTVDSPSLPVAVVDRIAQNDNQYCRDYANSDVGPRGEIMDVRDEVLPGDSAVARGYHLTLLSRR